jgi:hypothetical protein
MFDLFGKDAGTPMVGMAEMDRPAEGRLSVLAKSKS